MNRMRVLLLALAFVLYHSVAAAMPAHPCCPDEPCSLVECIKMGCVPAGMAPLAGASVPPVVPQPDGEFASAPPPPLSLPAPVDAVWRPPE